MSQPTIGERLAIVETQIDNIIQSGDRREEKQDEILCELRSAREAAEKVQKELARYKGFLGGAVFILSCIFTFFLKVGAPLYKLLTSLKTGN